MAMTKALPTSEPQSVELAWRSGNEAELIAAVVRKYARVLDMTDSGRDIKPLATGMFEALDRLKALNAVEGGAGSTDYASIIAEAEQVLADA